MELRLFSIGVAVSGLLFSMSAAQAANTSFDMMNPQAGQRAPDSVGMNAAAPNNPVAPLMGANHGESGYAYQGEPVPRLQQRESVAPPAWAQGKLTPLSSVSLLPFGYQLFQGRFSGTFSDTASPDYVVSPGDRVVIRIWGAKTYDDVLAVDQQGNLFLPDVGPVHVGGIKHGALASTVQSAIRRIYSNNVRCYVNLQSAQPVAVFVTGFVNLPGRYAGGSTDSVLSFIDRAGGINAERGSYREIEVKRSGSVISKLDLYEFLTRGQIAPLRLKEGDVIVVKDKGTSVSAYGLIREQAKYEFKGQKNATGAELIQVSYPLADASHVSVSGIRGKTPINAYLTLDSFRSFSLQSGDIVEFINDNHGDTILTQATGAIRGASRFPIGKTVKLQELLAQIAVEPRLADLSSVYIRRRSVARDQKAAILDSLHRLEKSALMATSNTPDEARVRVTEAKLIQDFVARASKIEPDGVVVVARKGIVSNIWLEEGDEVVIPQKTDVVQVTGEVILPKAVTFNPNLSLDDYLASAGGVTDRADDSHILVAKKNGEVGLAHDIGIEAGDRILVLPKVDTKFMMLAKDIMQIIYQIAVSTKVVSNL